MEYTRWKHQCVKDLGSTSVGSSHWQSPDTTASKYTAKFFTSADLVDLPGTSTRQAAATEFQKMCVCH